ncbi:MAG: hypothetical protein GX806_04745 [Lentisphaerae bacterium]|nr:hypothetical protein [Lentisphaerota bacterium]
MKVDQNKQATAAESAAADSYEVVDPNAPFENGFTWKCVAALLFVSIFMLPVSILLGYTTGSGIGSAVDWMVVIVFLELAKRALVRMKTQEIMMIYWIAAAGLGSGYGVWIWNQYLIQSPQAAGIRHWIPAWVVPSPDQFPELFAQRTFFHPAWLFPFWTGLVGAGLGLVYSFMSGYIKFRIFSDIEKLPFPLAKVQAFGATALAESSAGKETWRWRMFSAGAMIGLVWGAINTGIPIIGGLFWSPPPMLIKIPFWDFTDTLTSLGVYAVPLAVTISVGSFMSGWILPWRLVLGWFFGSVCTVIAFPILYRYGILKHWETGFGALATGLVNSIDFTISFQAGKGLLVALVGIISILQIAKTRRSQDREQRLKGGAAAAEKIRASHALPKNRGDIPLWAAFLIWLIAALLTVSFTWWLLNHKLLPGEIGVGLPALLFFSFILSPLFQYVNGRLDAYMGSGALTLPFMNEACIYLTGAKGARVWFAGLGLNLGGGSATTFKHMELTRTRFTSYYKMHVVVLLVLTVVGFFQYALIWKMGPIPSDIYPYIQRYWPFTLIQQIMWVKTTIPGEAGMANLLTLFLHPNIILAAFVTGVVLVSLLRVFRMPMVFFYGFVVAMGAPNICDRLFLIAGALMTRYLMAPRLGEAKWQAYAALLIAGFGAGGGLAGLFCVGFSMLWKAATGG